MQYYIKEQYDEKSDASNFLYSIVYLVIDHLRM